jgi:hypothetical protein
MSLIFSIGHPEKKPNESRIKSEETECAALEKTKENPCTVAKTGFVFNVIRLKHPRLPKET